ncbi:protein-disulfide reductase DsbD domain-containing protein [Xanthobacter versatilis]|uniref:protein-disulfide reductase DsbD domain-containing protein n=1 Tax=Xanthobacter autotrophicus (strain ATCC BAA-1158 / Py2) TaxID=78245 RepID=UPI00372CD9E9
MILLRMFAESGRLGLAALSLSGLWLAASPASAEAVAKVPGAEVELLAGAVSGAQAEAGIEVRLAPGWKTYWRYPGDSGVPPDLSFEGSQNVAGVTIAWPAPKRFADGGGGFSIGYKGAVLFPLKVELADPAKPARLQLAFDFAVCEALCMPAKVDLSLAIDAGGGADAARGVDAARIAAARTALPAPQALGAAETPTVRSVALDTTATPHRLVVEVKAMNPKADLFAEGPDAHWALPVPQKTALPDGAARFMVPLEGVPSGVDPTGALITFTLVDGPKSVTTTVPVPAP